MNSIDWRQVRSEFPVLSHWTHLDTATYGASPRRATEAVVRHLARRDDQACMDFLEWFDDLDRMRTVCAQLINCRAADIAFVTSASAGMALLVNGLTWQPGDEVITLEGEFPNQLYVSALLERYGAQLRTVPWSKFYDSVTPRTRLAVLSSVNYATGFRAPLEQISAFLAQRGVLLYVDGTQSVGALQFDVARVRPAMLSVNAYKWLMSPNGAGFVYVAPQVRERVAPSVVGWRSDAHWREVQNLHHGAPRFAASAERYEAGMPPFPSLYAMAAVIELLLELGPGAVEARVLELAAATRAMLRELDAEVNADDSPVVTAVVPGCNAAALAAALKAKRILTSARHGRLRVSPHLYNSEEDIHALRTALVGLKARSKS